MAALLHGEDTEPAVAQHLAICADCAHKFRAAQAAERIAGQQLAILDHSMPLVSPRDAMVPLKAAHGRHLKQVAAGITLTFLAFGAAAAVPASPIHKMLVRAAATLRPSRAEVGARPSPQGKVGHRADSNSGVLFVPDSTLEIVFRQVQAGGSIRVTFVNEALVSLNSLGGSSAFDLGQRQIIANNVAPSGNYSISIPNTLKSVRIRIGADTVFTRVGTDVRTVGKNEGHGSFVVAMSPRERKAISTYPIR
jgi:hypothetical protein